MGKFAERLHGGVAAEQFLQAVFEKVLLFVKEIERKLQITTDAGLHGVVVVTDDLFQHLCAKDWVAAIFFIGDDLQQDAAGNVVACVFIDDLESVTLEHQIAHFFQRDVAADFGVVQTAIGVLLDDAQRVYRPLLRRGGILGCSTV